MLLFARPPKPRLAADRNRSAGADDREPVDVRIPRCAAFTSTSTASAPPIPADAEMLKIVFQNLLVNGAQAMGGQGTIRVDVDSADESCRLVVHRPRPRDSAGRSRQDLHALLHHQVARVRPRAADRQAADRGSQRADLDRVSGRRRHDGDGHASSGGFLTPRATINGHAR